MSSVGIDGAVDQWNLDVMVPSDCYPSIRALVRFFIERCFV